MVAVTAMERTEFEASLAQDRMPDGLPEALAVLWLDAKGDWDEAHEVAQAIDGHTGSRLHAYLHRKVGDLANAKYWYRRAGVTMPVTTLDEEWRALVAASTE